MVKYGAQIDLKRAAVDIANNGQEAVDKLKANNDYDICLMDLQMPVMGGIEAAKVIRAEISKDLPIIAITAAVMDEDEQKVKEAGMNSFLTKPLSIDKLREMIIQYGKRNITRGTANKAKG